MARQTASNGKAAAACGGPGEDGICGTVHNLTLDITLFFTLVRGLTMGEAARLQQLDEKELRAHIERNRDTLLYKRLCEYYAALAEKRKNRGKIETGNA